MALIHSNEFTGLTTNIGRGAVANAEGTALNLLQDDLGNAFVPSPFYNKITVEPEDVSNIGTDSQYRKSRSYHTATGIPYMYDTGDITSGIVTYTHNVYGYQSTGVHQGYLLSWNLTFGDGQGGTTSGFDSELTAPNWHVGFSVCNQNMRVIFGMPNYCGTGVTDYSESLGIGGIRQSFLIPTPHFNPERNNIALDNRFTTEFSGPYKNYPIFRLTMGDATVQSSNNETEAARLLCGPDHNHTYRQDVEIPGYQYNEVLAPEGAQRLAGFSTHTFYRSQFGYSISDKHGVTVCGGPGYDNDRGLAVSYLPYGNYTFQIYRERGSYIYKHARKYGENPGDRFGQSVSAGYGKFIVGAPGYNSGEGKCYLYDVTPSGASLVKEISPVGTGSSFGHSVSIGSGRIAISNLAGNGSVSVYNLEGNLIGTVTAPDGSPTDEFGDSVCIDAGIIAVGAPGASININGESVQCGAVYAFDRNRVAPVHQSWEGPYRTSEGKKFNSCFVWKVNPSDGAAGDRFGDSLDIGSGRVLIGAPFKNNEDGAAYLYNLHGGFLQKVTGPTPGSHFGHAVSIDGHLAVVTAPYKSPWIYGSHQFTTTGETAKVPDSVFYYYTPSVITLYDAIDNNYGVAI